MATNQQHTAGVSSTEGPTIDEIPTVSPLKPNNDMSQEDAPNANREKLIHHTTQNATLMTIRPNSTTEELPKYAAPEIDVSSGPAMVTPLKLLKRDPKWIDCPFCKRMAETIVTLKEESEEPSGIMMCLVCLVCCPLLLCLPMMMGKTQSWTHACSNCNAIVAICGQQGQIEVKEPLPSKLVPSKFGVANHASMAGEVAPIQNSAKAQ